MADSVFKPTQPHFFQPILPNFHTHLAIPEAFFARYLEGKKPKSAVLKSNGGERSWWVKINGRRITDGWKEFVDSHDLRVGDIVMFRHDGRMVFHVTVFGPSGCEKQNAPFNGIKQEDASSSTQETQEEETSQDSMKKRAKKRSRTEAAANEKSSFVATVTPSSLKDNRMILPRRFWQSNGLRNKSGMILLMNKHKRTWKSCLSKKRDGTVYIKGGWRDFCSENDLKVGDLYGFKLSWKARTSRITLMDSDELLEGSREFLNGRKGRSRRGVSCSASHGLRFLTLVVSADAFSRGTQYVPKRFARANGLHEGHREITLMDKNGFCTVINLCPQKSSDRVYLGRGWKSFCVATGFKQGDSVRLELVPGKKLMLRFCSEVKTE